MRASEYENLILEELLTELRRTKQELIDMYFRLNRIIQTSEHEGEKNNARDLLYKVIKQLKDEYNWQPGESKTQGPPRQWQQRTGRDARSQAGAKAYQKSDDNAFKIVFFGRYVNPMAGQKGSDKVWGWGVKGNYIYHFWGPTGKTPQVKRMDRNAFNLDASKRKAHDKAIKGYKKMSAETSADWIRQVLQRNPKFSESMNEAYRDGIIDTWPRTVEEIFELAYSRGHYEINDNSANTIVAMDKFLKYIPFEDIIKQFGDEALLMNSGYEFKVKVKANIDDNKSKFYLEVIQ